MVSGNVTVSVMRLDNLNHGIGKRNGIGDTARYWPYLTSHRKRYDL